MINRISGNHNKSISPIPVKKQDVTFKGYGAAPLKEIYMQFSKDFPKDNKGVWAVFKELYAIGIRENIKVFLQIGDQLCKKPDLYEKKACLEKVGKDSYWAFEMWNQDRNMFVHTSEGERYCFTEHVKDIERLKAKEPHKVADQLKQIDNINTISDITHGHYKLPPLAKAKSAIEGGNLFIIKRDGDKAVIIGKDILEDTVKKNLCTKEEAIKLISEDLGVEEDKIFPISQPNYHLDTMLRPLKNNDILLNDFDLTNKLLENRKKIWNEEDVEELIQNNNMFKNHSGYASTDQMEKELNDLGFNVIRIPGVQRFTVDGDLANFMNSIVHERENGDLIYITNKCELNSQIFNFDFNKVFEEHLLKKVPYIKQVDFLSGYDDNCSDGAYLNYFLRVLRGGLHCLTTERPDFKKMYSK